MIAKLFNLLMRRYWSRFESRDLGYKYKLCIKLMKWWVNESIGIQQSIMEMAAWAFFGPTWRMKMAKLIGVNTKANIWWTPKSQHDPKIAEKDRTQFKVRCLDIATQVNLADDVYSVEGIGKERKEQFKTGTQQLIVLKKALKGWRNFGIPIVDDEGDYVLDNDGNIKTNEPDFDAKNMAEMIEMIPSEVRSELVDFVKGESTVNEGEGKS